MGVLEELRVSEVDKAMLVRTRFTLAAKVPTSNVTVGCCHDIQRTRLLLSNSSRIGLLFEEVVFLAALVGVLAAGRSGGGL